MAAVEKAGVERAGAVWVGLSITLAAGVYPHQLSSVTTEKLKQSKSPGVLVMHLVLRSYSLCPGRL